MAMSDVTQGLTADAYGQFHPVETDELIARKLGEMETHIAALPEQATGALREAQEKCPAQLTQDFKLMFLRSEVFNADLAAKRYAHYWDKRLEICGPDKAFLPMTLEGALRDDEAALTIGFVNYMAGGYSDDRGRGLMFMLPGLQDKTKYTRESLARAVWYMLHAALESPTAQKHGLLFLAFPKGARFSQFDPQLSKVVLPTIQGALPIRVSAFHICQPPAFIQLILPIIKLFMSDRTKKRMQLHFGSLDKIHKKLGKYGLTKANLPTVMGGEAVVDTPAFIARRRAEGK